MGVTLGDKLGTNEMRKLVVKMPTVKGVDSPKDIPPRTKVKFKAMEKYSHDTIPKLKKVPCTDVKHAAWRRSGRSGSGNQKSNQI